MNTFLMLVTRRLLKLPRQCSYATPRKWSPLCSPHLWFLHFPPVSPFSSHPFHRSLSICICFSFFLHFNFIETFSFTCLELFPCFFPTYFTFFVLHVFLCSFFSVYFHLAFLMFLLPILLFLVSLHLFFYHLFLLSFFSSSSCVFHLAFNIFFFCTFMVFSHRSLVFFSPLHVFTLVHYIVSVLPSFLPFLPFVPSFESLVKRPLC